MANSLVQKYRDALQAQGFTDPRSDDEITTSLGQLAEQSNRGLFDQYADFKTDYQDIRDANAPSLPAEAGRAIAAGTEELGSTAAGLGALLTDSDYLKGKARDLQAAAAAHAPTIPTMADIGGVKDALRYGVAKVAGAGPSLVEGVGLAAAGAAAGSALGPEGTVAGGIEGGIEGFLGKGIVKSAIRRLIEKQGDAMVASKLIPEATEVAVADTIKAGSPGLLKAVQTEASAIAARRGGLAANALNMYGLNAGGLYNETGNRELSAIGGAVGAAPAVVLPEIVVSKLYPGVASAVGQKLGNQYVTRLATEALKDAGVLGSAMALQETSNIIAGNIAAGREPTEITDADWTRIKEAGIGGVLTGPVAAPLTAADNAEAFNAAPPAPRAAPPAAAAERAPIAPPEAPPAPAMPPARRVALMSQDQKTARLTDLTARAADLTPDEQQEMEVLQAFVRPTEAAPAASQGLVPVVPAATPTPPVEANAELLSNAGRTGLVFPDKEIALRNADEGQEVRPTGGGAYEIYDVNPEPPPAAELPAAPGALEAPPDNPPQILPPAREEPGAPPEAAPVFELPPDLAGAKPRYSFGDKRFTLDFESDLDKAAYILAQSTASKREADYLKAVTDQTDLTEDQIRQHGVNVRAAIKEMAREGRGGETLSVPDMSAEAVPETPAAAPESAPLAPLPGPEPVQEPPLPGVPAAVAPAEPVPEPPQPPLGEAPPPAVPESPSLEQRLRDELQKPPPFAFGRVNESSGTVDLHEDPRFGALTGDQANNLPVENSMDDAGNPSKTRVSVVLEAPDGHYVQAGLLPAQEMASIGGAGDRATGPGVQSMAGETRKGGYQKTIREGGSRPALLADLVDAGYKLRAIVHFAEKPGKIFQRFDSRQAYDASYAASPKDTGTTGARTIPTATKAEGIARANTVAERSALEIQIDALSKQIALANPADALDLNEQLKDVYRRLGELPEPRLMSEAPTQPPLPIESDRTQQFAAATAAARQAGLKVDVLTQGILRANLSEELNRQMDVLLDRHAAAGEDDQPAVQAQIERLQQQLDAMERVRGVAYSPWHIALGLDDVRNQSISGMVALLHEIGHTILGRVDPERQAAIIRAVNGAFADLATERTGLEAQTGVREANLTDPEELLVSTMAQRLAAEGVPDSPSLARAIVQWVKDLYYRMAMGVQAAFGRTPDPQLALDWFENQLRRTVGGDYDYRFAGIFDRFQRELPEQQVVRYERSGGTPGGVSDFYDGLAGKVRQPMVLPDTREGVAWNLKFMADDTDAGKELDIPAAEANARILGAATNQISDLVEKSYSDIVPKVEGEDRMPFDEFWALAGYGDTPKSRLADIEARAPGAGTARIGGERMTDPMNQQATVEAKKLIYKARQVVVNREAAKTEIGTDAEDRLVDQAKLLNKIEGNLRNADMHESTLRDSLKQMIRQMARGVGRGLDTAFAAGGLARAVRETEGLSEREPIPKEYQCVFKAVLADEVPVFSYMDAIAKLDLPLHEMTSAEINSAIEDDAATDPTLEKLMENRPLRTALVALAKKESVQMDLLQMRAIKDPAEYLKLKGQLDEIRTANPGKFRELEKQISEGKKAATFEDRIRQNAIKARSKLRRLQDSIKESAASVEILKKVRAAFDQKIDDIETGGAPVPAEWLPFTSDTYMAMQQDKDGRWRSTERPLAWTPAGPAENPEQLASDLVSNAEYLRSNPDRKGSKTYEMVARQTQELQMVDAQRKTPEIKRSWYEKFFLPSSKLLVSGGGRGAAEAERMLNRFQNISTIKHWHQDFENQSIHWSVLLGRAADAAGMKDKKAFLDQIYEPALYAIENNPGLDEGPALREAVQVARRRLTTEAGPEFDERFKDFLRSTKGMSQRFLKVAEDSGLFVHDQRLDELRHAVDRGWLTVMRSMDSATVSTILRDMENSGWKMVFKDQETGAKAVRPLDKGAAAGQRVVAAASFDGLDPAMAANEADAKARSTVLESPEAFSHAITGFFPPGVVQRWLEPFINKPGRSAFSRGDEEIDPLDVQSAWQKSGGDVAKWIDLLGERVGLEEPMDEDESFEHGDLSLEAQWRMEMLKKLDSMFLMESRVAADSNQTRGLFDATGRPPHLIMDGRENDLLPPEHITHAAFDRDSSRNLLATLAFHGAFGRNGETMNRAIAEIQSNLKARKSAFDSVVGSNSGKAERIQAAKSMGYDFKDLQRAASIYHTVEQGVAALKAQFGFNSSATMLNDVRGGLELLHFIAAQTTNNPKTSFLNMLQPVQRAIARKSLGAVTLRDTGGAYGEIGKTFFGSVLEAFGLHLLRASRHAADIGASQGVAFGNQPWTVVAGIATGRRGQDLSPPIKAMRMISAAQRRGRVGLGEVREFPALQAIPVLNNVMNGVGLTAAISDGVSEARSIESLVNAAMHHFAANPDHLNDPTYRLTHQDIAQQDRALALDKGAFDYLRSKMVEYNIGPLERVAKDAMDRQTRGEPILTKDQVLKAAQLAGNEVDLHPSINTSPALWDTNPVLKFATPLLGWPIRQMAQVHEAMRNAEGRATALQALKTLGILAGWSMPIGLAFTFLTDQYDDKILKKKTNLGNVDATAAIPGVGPGLALATSDLPAKDQALAMFQRLSRAGNIYGLGFDMASSILGGVDPTSGQRPFSMDGRVLAFSQILNLTQALSNWYNSGFATTYANAERPLIQALVGSGPLQAVDVIGNALGIDSQEMRITQRTNASQWLRAAGRENGQELRASGGASTAPTPMSVWTREMYLAALGQDRLDFMDAYRRAVDAAREDGSKNPEQTVLESWRSRNPLDVFKTRPDEVAMARMLGSMSDNGRNAVQDALRLFQQYSELIATTPADRYEHRVLAQARQIPNVNALRAQMAGGALGGFYGR